MPILSIPAHFDGKQVKLDEDVSIPQDAQLIVTVLESDDAEREDFLRLASQNLSRAYEGDEVEYSLADCIDE